MALSVIYRWGLWRSAIRPPRPVLYRDNTTAHLQPIFFIQGKCRPVCTGISQNLWNACNCIPLLQQLWPISFPWEADPADHQPCISRWGASCIRNRLKCTWLASCIRSLRSNRPDHPQGPCRWSLQHWRTQRENQSGSCKDYLKGIKQAGKPDQVCNRPPGPWPPLCHRPNQDRDRIRLEAKIQLWYRNSADHPVVSGQPGMVEKYFKRWVQQLLR